MEKIYNIWFELELGFREVSSQEIVKNSCIE